MKEAMAFLAGFLTGILSGFGIGGGTLLLLYMTLLAGVGQQFAQGINLLYFLPASAASLLSHRKNGYLDPKAAFPAILAGIVCTALASWAAVSIDVSMLRRLFGVFLICVGLYELFGKSAKKEGSA